MMRILGIIGMSIALLALQGCKSKTHELHSPCVAIEPAEKGAQFPCVRRPVNGNQVG